MVNVVTAKGWAPEGAPVANSGASVRALAKGLNHPRWLYVLPNGDVLVAETNAPARPDNGPKGIKGWFFKKYQKKAVGAVDEKASGTPFDILTGFVQENGDAMGRPVGVAIARDGSLLVADDVGNTIWRVVRHEPTADTPR